MKKITIIGVGMGPDTVTKKGMAAIENADTLIGARRMLSMFSGMRKSEACAYLPHDVLRAIEESASERFAVLLSGDTGFFSAADGLVQALSQHEITLVPGISSLSFLFARLKRPWQEAAVVSCHGREGNVVDTVRRNRLTFVLTGGNTQELGRRLCDARFEELHVIIGENLGMQSERICDCSVSELPSSNSGVLCVLLIENPEYDACMRYGIADEAFIRGDIPMTKSEVRAVTLSKLAIAPEFVCCDIGCGTGSVTVEMALAAYSGHIYAIDKNEGAVTLTQKNCAAFHIGNVTIINGCAPEAIAAIPPVDTAFIGGSGGNMCEIFAAVLQGNPHARIVVNAIALESVHAAQAAFSAHGLEPEIVQLCVSRTKPIAGRNMLTAQNPVFILSGGGYE